MTISRRWLLTLAIAAGFAAGTLAASCGSDGRDNGESDADADTDGDTDTWDDYKGPTGTLNGVVYAPNGVLPVAGALVYVELGMPEEIPNVIHCEACEDMTAHFWTLTAADGSFQLSGVPALEWNFVVQKGLFRRISTIEVVGGEVQDIPASLSTLPADNSGDGMDRIPSFAVAKNGWDLAEDMLTKLGMGDVDASGHLVIGTENFDLYNDDAQAGPSYPDSTALYASFSTMEQYHMIFMPCTSGTMESQMLANDTGLQTMRSYVSAGGKLYGSCYAYDWVEQPFHQYIQFPSDDANSVQPSLGSSTVSAYDTTGRIEDTQMREWLAVVTPGQNPDAFPFTGAWVYALNTIDVDDGHGLEDNNGVVMPKTWVTDLQQYANSPLTVTYDYDCGRIFFSAYQVVESSPSPAIRPQEAVLIYLMMEVGVCSGDYVIE
jgi:hypothetical protein